MLLGDDVSMRKDVLYRTQGPGGSRVFLRLQVVWQRLIGEAES
jgi:hypothetical protein